MPTEPTLSPERRDPDLDRIEAFRRGEATAFDDLVRRHETRVLRLCTRVLGDSDAALDAAQETFVKAWRALPQFHGDARFLTWLTRIAINQCRNDLRRRKTVKHTQPLSIDAVSHGSDSDETVRDDLAASGPDPFEAARGREVAAAVKVALAELDDEAREIIALRDAEELAYEEIAVILDVPVGTVRSRLHRARGELRRRLGPVLDDVPLSDAARPDASHPRAAFPDAAFPDTSLPDASLPDAAP
jgi:RNA polymerase sigma-70 factor, ECF subfamily